MATSAAEALADVSGLRAACCTGEPVAVGDVVATAPVSGSSGRRPHWRYGVVDVDERGVITVAGRGRFEWRVFHGAWVSRPDRHGWVLRPADHPQVVEDLRRHRERWAAAYADLPDDRVEAVQR